MLSKARVVAVVPLMLTLAACESSSRLGSMLPGGSVGPSPRVSSRGAPAPLTPAPIGDVQTSDLSGGSVASSSLPPPTSNPSPSMPPRSGGLSAPGNFGSSGAPIDPPPAPPVAAPAPSAPGAPTYYPSGSAPAPGANPATPPRVATAPSAPAAAPTSRTAVVGNWSVSEAQGSSCRITLSSAPKLDLYGAGTSGCQTKELQRVNAWELSGSELLLYEPGGGVVARLRQSGGGYSGATARTGAPVSIAK